MLITVVSLVLLFHQYFLKKITKYVFEFLYMRNIVLFTECDYIFVYIFDFTDYNCYLL